MPINTTTLNDVVVHVFPDIPTYTTNKSQVGTNDLVQVDPESLQDKLVSGTNIKTINGESILGTGDITVEGGKSSAHLLSIGDEIEDEDIINAVAENITGIGVYTATYWITTSQSELEQWMSDGDVIRAMFSEVYPIDMRFNPVAGLYCGVSTEITFSTSFCIGIIIPCSMLTNQEDDNRYVLFLALDLPYTGSMMDSFREEIRETISSGLSMSQFYTDGRRSYTVMNYDGNFRAVLDIYDNLDHYILFKNTTNQDIIVNTFFHQFTIYSSSTPVTNPTIIMPKDPVTLPAGCAVEASYINPPGTNDIVITFSDILALPE